MRAKTWNLHWPLLPAPNWHRNSNRRKYESHEGAGWVWSDQISWTQWSICKHNQKSSRCLPYWNSIETVNGLFGHVMLRKRLSLFVEVWESGLSLIHLWVGGCSRAPSSHAVTLKRAIGVWLTPDSKNRLWLKMLSLWEDWKRWLRKRAGIAPPQNWL